jgi:SAM-dependent methyltransferase
MPEKARSYTSLGGSLRSQFRDLADLFRGARQAGKNASGGVDEIFKRCELAESAYQRLTGREAKNLDMLDIGPGQSLPQMLCFAQKNQVIGIDLDWIGQGISPAKYWRILRANGPKRLIKSIGRDLLVSDRAFKSELARRLGVKKLRRGRVMQMDAAKMSFPDASFDLVYSFNVLEHIPDPRAVFKEIRRVLKPGGVVFSFIHLFTSDSGFHDLRVIADLHDGIPYWAHLRPAHLHQVKASSYLNELRLAPWIDLLNESLPGGEISYIRDDDLRGELDAIRAAGELKDYSDDELLIRRVLSAWKKPEG